MLRAGVFGAVVSGGCRDDVTVSWTGAIGIWDAANGLLIVYFIGCDHD